MMIVEMFNLFYIEFEKCIIIFGYSKVFFFFQNADAVIMCTYFFIQSRIAECAYLASNKLVSQKHVINYFHHGFGDNVKHGKIIIFFVLQFANNRSYRTKYILIENRTTYSKSKPLVLKPIEKIHLF